MDDLQVPPALPLAEVRTPTGAVWYIPHAQRYGDFVVQRRYRGTGEPFYTLDEEEQAIWENIGQFIAYLAPFLNPEAVRVAGFDLGSIMSQVAQHPEQIFTHPTYAQLCLRWGENAGGYVVRERVPEPLPDERAIPFTPYTCWLTGTTYYRLDFAEQGAVFEKLLLRASLRAHEQEIGLEGNWCGWYVTDLSAVGLVLAESGQYPVVSSAQSWHGLKVVDRPSGIEHWVRGYTTAEEAFALYQKVPELAAEATTQSWTLLQYGRVTQWPGRAPEWHMLGGKEIEGERAKQLLTDKSFGTHALQVLPKIMTHEVLAEVDWPLMPRVITLGERLNTLPVSRVELARVLEWSLDTLVQRERNPEKLTLAQVQQLAHMLSMQEELLLQELKKEIQARHAHGELRRRYMAARLPKAAANR